MNKEQAEMLKMYIDYLVFEVIICEVTDKGIKRVNPLEVE